MPELARLRQEDLIVTSFLAEMPDDIAALRELLDEADRQEAGAVFINLTMPWSTLERRFLRDLDLREAEGAGKLKDVDVLEHLFRFERLCNCVHALNDRGTVGACVVNADLREEVVLNCVYEIVQEVKDRMRGRAYPRAFIQD